MLAPAAASGQAPGRAAPGDTVCATAVISQLVVENRSIYGAEEDPAGSAQGWAGGLIAGVRELANRMHRRTRSGLIARELLLGPGDCLDPLRMSESERILRGLPFLAEADVRALPDGDGKVRLHVTTRDDWTLELDVRPAWNGGPGFAYLGITEENFWGTGTLMGVYLREQEEQRDVGAQVRTPRFLGTRADAAVSGGRTRIGRFFSESVAYPFVGEVGRWAFEESFSFREDLFPYAASADETFTQAVLPVRAERAEATLGRRFGRPGDLAVVAAGLSWEEVRHDGFPGEVHVIPGWDYADRAPADEDVVAAISPQVAPRRVLSLNLVAGKRNVRHVTRRGLDAIRGEQDVRVGAQALVFAGTSLGDARTGVAGRDREHRGGLRLFGGAAGADWVFSAEAALDAAWLAGPGGTMPAGGSAAEWENAGGVRNVLGELDAYFYWQPGRTQDSEAGATTDRVGTRHTVVVRLSGAGGWDVRRPFQLTLGGPHGVRGYNRYSFPGGRRLVGGVEDRIYVGGPFNDLFDLGIALFADIGAVWDGGVPFGEDSGARGAAGAGVRIALPSGARRAVRLDVAAPLHRDFGVGDLQLRVGYDAVSLLAPFRNRQVARSRGAGPSSVFLGGR